MRAFIHAAESAFARVLRRASPCVMKDDAQHAPVTGGNPAHAVTHVRARESAASGHGTFKDRENNQITKVGIQHGDAGLLARPVFDENKFSSFKLVVFATQHDHRLKRKERRTVEIPVQTIKIATAVPKQEGRWLRLPLTVTRASKGGKG